ncbi:hypothetical protein EDC01DRAFT_634098 [Geopyxis carbonaria]|nr:hypothetical protein EDC01DRAFT_634098 [Geopyxis carbonaria]
MRFPKTNQRYSVGEKDVAIIHEDSVVRSSTLDVMLDAELSQQVSCLQELSLGENVVSGQERRRYNIIQLLLLNKILRERIASLESNGKTHTDNIKALEELHRTTLDGLRSDLNRVQRELNLAKVALASAGSTNSTRLHELENDLASKVVELDRAKEVIHMLSSGRWEEKYKELKRRVNRGDVIKGHSRSQSSAVVDNRDLLIQEREKHAKEMTELEQQHAQKLNNVLEELNSVNSNFEEMRRLYQDDINYLQQLVDNAHSQHEYESLKQSYLDLQKDYADLKEEMAIGTAILEKNSAVVQKAEQKVAEKDKRIAQLDEQNNVLLKCEDDIIEENKRLKKSQHEAMTLVDMLNNKIALLERRLTEIYNADEERELEANIGVNMATERPAFSGKANWSFKSARTNDVPSHSDEDLSPKTLPRNQTGESSK